MEEETHTPTAAYSIMAILRNDPDYAAALKKRGDDLVKDKQGLIKASEKYSKKYETEVEEGTKNYQKLIGEGKVDGLEGSAALGGKFIPTKYTPILNFLFFALRDEDTNNVPKRSQEEIVNEFLKQFTDKGFDKSELIDLYLKGIVDKLPDGYDDEEIDFDDVINEENTNDPEEMEYFIYGNLSHNDFKKLKKLKALSKSSNEQEAFLAYRKCLELCKKCGLEFDKIPCSYQ